jgi:glycosyltransferase involved in cell wall biosynthesis
MVDSHATIPREHRVSAVGCEEQMKFGVNLLAHGELFGGAERQLTMLADGLRRKDVDVRAEVFFDRQLAGELRAMGVPVRCASAREILSPLPDSAPSRDYPFVAHSHGPRGTFLASRRRDLPMVRTEHGLLETDANLTLRSLRPRAIRRWEEHCLIAARATLVYVTADLASRRPARLATLPMQVIHNGVELPDKAQLARPAELRGDRFNVVFAGRLEPTKAPLDAVAAACQVPRDSRVHLVMLGDGPLHQQTRDAVAAGGGDRVSMLGFRSDALSFLAHADAVIMSSLHEGLPFTAMESLGFGVPLISTDVGGLHEVLRDRETALLVPPSQPPRLMRAMLELEDDADLRAGLSERGKNFQRAELSAHAMVARYIALYTQLLAPRAR